MEAIDLLDLVELVELRRDTSVHSEVLSIDNARNGHRVEDLHEEGVGLHVIASDGLFTEGEVLRHVATLVVSSEQDHILLVVDLDRHQKDKHLYSEDPSVYVVT